MDQTLITPQFLEETRLTPRSAEAFKKSGVLPEDILYPEYSETSLQTPSPAYTTALKMRENFL